MAVTSSLDPDLPPPPRPPAPGDCCGGGCARCVIDLYEEELARWRERVAAITAQRERERAADRHP